MEYQSISIIFVKHHAHLLVLTFTTSLSFRSNSKFSEQECSDIFCKQHINDSVRHNPRWIEYKEESLQSRRYFFIQHEIPKISVVRETNEYNKSTDQQQRNNESPFRKFRFTDGYLGQRRELGTAT